MYWCCSSTATTNGCHYGVMNEKNLATELITYFCCARQTHSHNPHADAGNENSS